MQLIYHHASLRSRADMGYRVLKNDFLLYPAGGVRLYCAAAVGVEKGVEILDAALYTLSGVGIGYHEPAGKVFHYKGM